MALILPLLTAGVLGLVSLTPVIDDAPSNRRAKTFANRAPFLAAATGILIGSLVFSIN